MKQIRKVVKIDEAKCNGCGLCVPACAERAIEIVNGKARLASDACCDGLGACLGKCPQHAITVEERPADEFNAKATERRLAAENPAEARPKPAHAGCPGSRMMSLRPPPPANAATTSDESSSQLSNWPVKMVLAPITAPWYSRATLLIAADCSAFAHGDFHRRFLSGKPLLTFCPKFGEMEESKAKLAEILRANDVLGIEVLYMQVPCCRGLAWLVQEAAAASGKEMPITLTKLGLRGEVLETEEVPAGTST